MQLVLQVTVDGVSTRKDGSFKLTFSTQELPGEEAAVLFTMANKLGWLAFSSDYIENQTIEELSKKPVEQEGKSISQRERAVLFVLWDKKGRPGEFESFRNAQGEKFIERIKEEIDKY